MKGSLRSHQEHGWLDAGGSEIKLGKGYALHPGQPQNPLRAMSGYPVLLCLTQSSACSIKATFPRLLRNCLFMASKEKSARMFPSMAFRLLFLKFHVKPLKHSEGLRGNGPSSFAQGTLLKVEHGGVMIKASISPASISCNHLRCTSGCEQSAFRLCRGSTSITSST